MSVSQNPCSPMVMGAQPLRVSALFPALLMERLDPGAPCVTMSLDPLSPYRRAARALCRPGLKVQSSRKESGEVWATGVSGPGLRGKRNKMRTLEGYMFCQSLLHPREGRILLLSYR